MVGQCQHQSVSLAAWNADQQVAIRKLKDRNASPDTCLELLAQVSELAGPGHRGEDIRQPGQQKAERIVHEELGKLGWSVQDLAGRPKGDPRKLRIAGRLRRETTMTLAWIAQRLYMGAPGHVSCLLYRKERNQAEAGDGNSENKWF